MEFLAIPLQWDGLDVFFHGSVEFVTSYHGIAYHKAHPSDEIRDISPRK